MAPIPSRKVSWHLGAATHPARRFRLSRRHRGTVVNTGDRAKSFPVVCVGGSAGGLDAYVRLLQQLPADLGVALVIVNHQRVGPTTQLHHVLQHYTTMPVELISEGLNIQPNRVFVIPAQRDLHVLNGEFLLKPISKPRGWPDVITVFLCSLIAHWKGKVIAVIVSGYDGDGAAALCSIKEAGGITIAQKLETASQPDMPETAIATGCIDFVLSPEDIAGHILQIARGETTATDGASERAALPPVREAQ
jgi:two-component system, chemotaxis family, protein-glutamate methylesterase/glutaminase